MTNALRHHWPEYLIEAACLGLFMISAFTFGALLEHPASPLRQAVLDPLLRRFLMGLAMGATAVGIIYSPWGKQSGAHINPSVTLTFFRLGKVKSWDALYYVVFQFAGGLLGALVASFALAAWASHPSVNYVVTAPGHAGVFIAFIAEIVITFILMTVILHVSNAPKLVGQQVQAGRLALQTGRPNDAVAFLTQAAEQDPDYKTPYLVREGVLTYLGRAYYETGRNAEARSTLEKALAKDKDDPLAHLYLGLTLARNGKRERGHQEINSGLKGILETLEYIATNNLYGHYWDPAMQIRSDIRMTLAGKNSPEELTVSAQRIGALFDEEIDKARSDESRSRRGGDGGGGGN
ncbi:MAG TPA: aquaporin [Candidatus Binatia bacterium]|jgi:glycerol uptake facilitator-like aquaporin